MPQYSIGIDLDWRKAKESTSQFLSQFRADIAKLSSGAAAGGPATAPDFGKSLAQVQQIGRTLLRDLKAAGVDVEKIAKDLGFKSGRSLQAQFSGIRTDKMIGDAASQLPQKQRAKFIEEAGAAYRAERDVLSRNVEAIRRLAPEAFQLVQAYSAENKFQNEVNQMVEQRIATLRRGIAYQRAVVESDQDIAALAASEAVLRRRNLAEQKKIENTILAGPSRNARDIRTFEAQAAVQEAKRKGLQFGAEEKAGLPQEKAALALAQERASLQQRLIVSRRILGHEVKNEELSSDLVSLKGLTIAAEKERLAAERVATNAALRDAGLQIEEAAATGAARQPTKFQRFQASVYNSQGLGQRDAASFQTLRQGFLSRAITTAQFGTSAAILYGGVNLIKNVITEADELDVELNILESQFTALAAAGEDLGAPLEEALHNAREEIFDIASATGVATDAAAKLAVQFIGAFGAIEGLDAERIAAKIGVIGDLDPAEIFNDLVAGAKAFKVEGETNVDVLTRIADVSTQIRNVTGVQQKESIDFLGRVGPIATTAGLSLEEAGAAGAALLQGSGVGGAALGEQFSRILTEFQSQSVVIAETVAQSQSLKDAITKNRGGDFKGFAEDLGKGDASVLFDLAEGFKSLSKEQQRNLIISIGQRREGQTLAVLLQNAETLIKARAQALNSEGTAEDEFLRRQKTLKFQLAQLRVEFEQFALALYEGGLESFLKNIVAAGRVAIDIFEKLGDVLGFLNKLTFGWADDIAAALLAAGALSKTLAAMQKFSIIQSLVGGTAAFFRPGGVTAFGANNRQAIGGVNAGASAALQGGTATAFTARAVGLGARGSIGLAAGFLVFDTFNKKSAEVSHAADNFVDSLRKLSDDEVEQITRKRTGAFDTFALSFFGESTPEKLGRREQERRLSAERATIDRAEAARTVGLDPLRDIDAGQRRFLVEDLDQRFGPGGPNSDLTNKEAFQRVFPSGFGGKLTGELLTESGTERTLDNLKSALDDNLDGANEIFEILFSDLETFIPKFQENVSAKVKELQAQAAIDNLTDTDAETGATVLSEKGEGVFKDLDSLRAQLDVGDITKTEFVQQVDAYRADLIDSVGGLGNANDALVRLFDEMDKAARKIESQSVLDSYNFQFEGLSLRGASPDEELQNRIDALNDAQITDPEARFGLAKEIIGLQQDILQQEADMADTAEEEIRILRDGLEIPDEARTVLLTQFISEIDPLWQAFLITSFGSLENAADFIAEVVQLAVANGIDVAKAAELVIKANMDLIQSQISALINIVSSVGLFQVSPEILAQLQTLYGAQAALEKQQAALDSLPNSGVPGRVTDEFGADQAAEAERKRREAEAKQAAEEARREARAAALARLAIEEAKANGDPVKLARLAQQRASTTAAYAETTSERLEAFAQMIDANNQLADAMNDIAEAQRDLKLARSGDDPVDTARKAIADAYVNIATAKGQAERLRAQADIIRAQRDLQTALFDLFSAQQEILIATAEAAGDSVKAAQLQLALINQRLRQAGQLGLSDAERAQLQGDRIRAEAGVRDAILSEERATIEYQLAIGDITKQQAVAALQSLLTIPKLTEEQIRDINLAIQQLKEQLGADFQFNLPTQLGLPTVYEVKRLGDSGGTGSSYQDNRQISVNVYAETNASAEDIGAAVASAVGDPTRSGTIPKRY